ncbi:MAG: hypothetical protein HZA20_03525 [Nitrospirae bacterium]|nr:hypothetical protein [Nitrospirota bacterium]
MMALVSAIFMLAMPDFMALADDPLKREAMRLASVIRHENDEAITRKETRSVTFNLGDGSWTLRIANLPEGATERFGNNRDGSTERFGNNVRFVDIVTHRRGRVDEGEDRFIFGVEGITESAIIHVSKDESVYSIIVHPYAALVETREGYVEQTK